MTDRDKLDKLVAEIEKQKQLIWPKNDGQMKAVGTPGQLEQGWLNALKWMKDIISSMQKETATSVWHDANEAPVNDEKHLWVIASFKDGDIHTCSVSTLVKWQNVQLDAIDCWAYREDLLNIK